MEQVDTLLFDWDGTLAQTLEVWLKTFKEAYAKAGVYPTDKEISSRFGKWDAYKELGVTPENEKKYHDYLEVVYERLEHVELYPGAKNTLENAKRKGYKLGLVSTSRLKMLEKAMASEGLADLFDAVVTADDTDAHKPDPTPLFLCLEKLGSKVVNSVFVGDSDKDTGAANNAHMPLYLFAPTKHTLFYNLDELKSEACVKAVFEEWSDFPFDQINSTIEQ